MAKEILRDARIEINGVVLSDHANQVEVPSEKEEQDVTGFGATSREIQLGLGDASISMTLFQDFATGSVHATLWPIHRDGTAVVVKVRKSSAAISATNPEWTMTGVLPAYTPLSGGVGEPSTIEATFRNASQAGITQAIA